MSRDASGNFTLAAGNPVIPATVIATGWANPTLADIAAGLTDSLSRSGKGGMGAELSMGGFRITALAAAILATDAPQATQVRDNSFSWLNPVFSGAGGNDYTGTSLVVTAPVNGTTYLFLADRTNTGAMTLSVNGGTSWPVQVHGSPCPPGLVQAGAVVQVAWVTNTWRLVSISAGNGTINSVQSDNTDAISVTNDLGTGIATLNVHANVANGLSQLDGSTKVPIAQLPFTNLAYIGNWNAGPGINPAAAVNGQFYIIVGAGNLTIFRNSGGNVYTAQVTACVVGDAIIYNTVNTVNQPIGWYYDPAAAAAAVAATVSMVATPTLPATVILQTWLNQMDPIIGAKLPKAGGTMTGAILQPLAPSVPNELANKQYVDSSVASLVGVLSFNLRTGVVTLTALDVTTALTYTPLTTANPVFTGTITGPTANFSGVASANRFAMLNPPLSIALGANRAIDWNDGQTQQFSLTVACTITAISNVPINSMLRLIFNAATFNVVAWPVSVKWPGGVVPNLSGGPTDWAVVTFVRDFAGNLYGNASLY
jgi:hypothetical protein